MHSFLHLVLLREQGYRMYSVHGDATPRSGAGGSIGAGPEKQFRRGLDWHSAGLASPVLHNSIKWCIQSVSVPIRSRR